MKPTQSSQIDSFEKWIEQTFHAFSDLFFGTEANTNVRTVWDSDLRNQLVELYKIYFTLFFWQISKLSKVNSFSYIGEICISNKNERN